MKKSINKYIIPICLFTLGVFGTVIAIDVPGGALNGSFVNDDANTTGNDKWEFTGSVGVVDISDTRYGAGVRGEISGIIQSDLFGTFNATSLLLSTSTLTTCTSGETYTVSGNLISSSFGVMTTQAGSYFCPLLSQIVLVANSDLLGNKQILQDIGGSIVPFNIFDKTQISVNGITNIKGEGTTTIGGTVALTPDDLNNITFDSNAKNIAKQQVNKNLALIKKSEPILTANTPITSLLGSNKTYYYDLSTQTTTDNGYGNFGQNVRIGTSTPFNSSIPSDYSMKVENQKNIIVEGGNIYINADIYNANDSALLTIVALKDDSGIAAQKNGGNIYIHPDVTNIDAIIIAEGSILNYDGVNILDKSDTTDFDKLRRQLYIYGSVLSANVVGSDKIPYGADLYGSTTTFTQEQNIYDFTNLRSFQPRYASGTGTVVCGGNATLWVGMDDTNAALPYSWAGKSECFNQQINPGSGAKGIPVSGLRTVNKFNSVVIGYNPNIARLNPVILRK